MKKTISITLDEKLYAQIKDFATKEYMSVSAVITEALKLFLKSREQDN